MTEEKQVENVKPEVKTKRKHKPVVIVILLVILSIVFVLTSLLAVVGYDVWRVAFNPTLLKRTLTEEFVDSALIPRVLEDISIRRAQERIDKGEALSGVNEPDITLLISFVDFEQWVQMKDLLVTDEFITHLISVSVDGLYGWLDSSDITPQFVWDMTPLKDRLVGEEGCEAILIAYDALPECTDEEIADFESRLASMPPNVEVLYNLCQFPDPYREDQIDDYVHALIDVNQNVPAQYDFGKMLGGGDTDVQGSQNIKTVLRAVRTLGQLLWIVPLVTLALIAAIGVRSLGDAGGWLGIPMFISGSLTVAGTLLARASFLKTAFNRLGGAEISTLLRAEVERSFTHLTGYIFCPLWIEGLIVLGIGLLLILAWIIWGGKKKENAPVEVEVMEEDEEGKGEN